jgi:hypothetical protein
MSDNLSIQGELSETTVPDLIRSIVRSIETAYLPLDAMGATIFFQLVSARYERGSIILTSNKSYAEWGHVFGDPIIATAILDRLLHHSVSLNIRGESYRLKERRKAGLLATSGTAPAAASGKGTT